MKKIVLILLTLTIVTSMFCKGQVAEVKIISDPKDKEIAQQVFEKFANEKNVSTAELVVKIGTYFKETPYVGHTLEIVPEKLVVNLRELDCTTYAETVLALARTVKSNIPDFEKFCKELQTIRYHEGKINGYTSRIHYFSDWIFENAQKGIISDVSEEIANVPYPLNVNFMSTHPESYKQLKQDNGLIPVISKQEKTINERKMYFIPEEKLAGVEEKLMDGDIVGLTTAIRGMDVSHVGILVRQNGRIHLMHASSVLKKVVVSEETLEEYLKSSKSTTGIIVARPK